MNYGFYLAQTTRTTSYSTATTAKATTTTTTSKMTTIQPIVQQAQERSSLQNQTGQQISKFISQQQTLQELMKGDLKIFTIF